MANVFVAENPQATWQHQSNNSTLGHLNAVMHRPNPEDAHFTMFTTVTVIVLGIGSNKKARYEVRQARARSCTPASYGQVAPMVRLRWSLCALANDGGQMAQAAVAELLGARLEAVRKNLLMKFQPTPP